MESTSASSLCSSLPSSCQAAGQNVLEDSIGTELLQLLQLSRWIDWKVAWWYHRNTIQIFAPMEDHRCKPRTRRGCTSIKVGQKQEHLLQQGSWTPIQFCVLLGQPVWGGSTLSWLLLAKRLAFFFFILGSPLLLLSTPQRPLDQISRLQPLKSS